MKDTLHMKMYRETPKSLGRFSVVCLRDEFTPWCKVIEVFSTHPTLLGAFLARRRAGDVVVYEGTSKVVPTEMWLWNWERSAPESYASRLLTYSKEQGNNEGNRV